MKDFQGFLRYNAERADSVQESIEATVLRILDGKKLSVNQETIEVIGELIAATCIDVTYEI